MPEQNAAANESEGQEPLDGLNDPQPIHRIINFDLRRVETPEHNAHVNDAIPQQQSAQLPRCAVCQHCGTHHPRNEALPRDYAQTRRSVDTPAQPESRAQAFRPIDLPILRVVYIIQSYP